MAELGDGGLGVAGAGEILGEEDDNQIVSALGVVQDSGIVFYIGKLSSLVGDADTLWQGCGNLVASLLLFQKSVHIFSVGKRLGLGCASANLVDLFQEFSTIIGRSVIIPKFIAGQEQASHRSAGVTVSLAEAVYFLHTSCAVPTAQAGNQAVGSVIVTDGDHRCEIAV